MSGTVILIDVKNQAYRQHYSHLALATREGEPTGVLHGVLWEVFRISKTLPEAAFVFCWDGKSPTWRHILRPDYKANRKKDETALKEWNRLGKQLKPLEQLLVTLGFHSINVDGVEADDVIGIMTEALFKAGKDVIIYSGDKDMYQLVRKGVKVWPGWKTNFVDELGVEKVFGVRPKDVPELRAMIGDASDNLKGLPRIGPKKALTLLASGLRPSQTDYRGCGALGLKYKNEWDRVHQEWLMGKIVTDPKASVWTKSQSEKLTDFARQVAICPYREPRHSYDMQKMFYRFLGRWELKELFEVRSEFWEIP